ncbi:MAG: YecA family protein [Vogesella sp.]|nr:YecA family protein [Vogesella sp.]
MTVFNEADLTRLETLLTPLSQAGTTMRPDEVQGFFTALACGPDRLGVDEWLDDVLGDAPAFESAETEAEIRALLQKFYDSVAAALAEGELPELVLYSADDSDEPDFRPWCNAYMYALDVVPTDWFEAADDEGFEELLMPVMALGGMFDAEEGEAPLMQFSASELESFKGELDDAVVAVHNYWRAKEAAPVTVRNDGKVGRNDPCTCGSGKKYKACCGRN